MGRTSDVNPNEFERDMDEAVQAVIAKHEKSFVYKWVMVLDTDDIESEATETRGVWILHTPGAVMWDVVGLLRHAIKLNDADVIRVAIQED